MKRTFLPDFRTDKQYPCKIFLTKNCKTKAYRLTYTQILTILKKAPFLILFGKARNIDYPKMSAAKIYLDQIDKNSRCSLFKLMSKLRRSLGSRKASSK